jgi:hypothetical protein
MIISREVLNAKPKEKFNENFDIFGYTLEAVSEMNDSISSFMDDMLLESVGKKRKIIDFEAIINAIIEAFINAIKKLFRKFLAFLAQLASMGSSFEIELKAFKDRIKYFNGTVKVSNAMFYFANLDDRIPPSDVFEFPKGVIALYNDKFNDCVKTPTSAASKLAELESKIVIEDEVNKFRNYILGGRGSEAFDNFSADCFRYFRSGNDYPVNDQTLQGRDIYDHYYLPYIDSKAEIKKVEQEQRRVEKIMNVVKASIKKENFKDPDASYRDAAYLSQLEQATAGIQRKLCTIVDLMCQDLLILYGQKLQAYKDFRIQCRGILLDTIKACIVQKGGQA